MSPLFDLSQVAINSLDGSPAALQAREEIDRLLGQVGPRRQATQVRAAR
jgi:hypothetical protein